MTLIKGLTCLKCGGYLETYEVKTDWLNSRIEIKAICEKCGKEFHINSGEMVVIELD